MAFWDEITKGAKDAAAFTMKKTEEITNLAKVKLALHSEESKLDKCYSEIGELYYDFQRKEVEHAAEIAALLLEADELNTKVDALKAQLAALQNDVICKDCGAQIPVEATFCPICGKKQDEEDIKEEAAE
ncbi:MAG: zinc ribbon domain-containing protein [Clostridia bacterium]|nr:zinc ribbon domain-containing protein [Clostridia bacterium]